MSIKITALVENNSHCALKAVHGLSLYIKTPKHKLMFDLGPDNTLFENAELLGLDLGEIDTVVISHGHDDHGGGLKRFLEINSKAKVYVQESAFGDHFSIVSGEKEDIGIDKILRTHERVMLTHGNFRIDDELEIFTAVTGNKYRSDANDFLYSGDNIDGFSHEQNLIIHGENADALVMGCGHRGIVNILDNIKGYNVKTCVGGFHLFNPSLKKTAPEETLSSIAKELDESGISFYTCHCTGMEAFEYLEKRCAIKYLYCGETIEI